MLGRLKQVSNLLMFYQITYIGAFSHSVDTSFSVNDTTIDKHVVCFILNAVERPTPQNIILISRSYLCIY